MKILLIGEYSNLHNSLKHGLICRGHTVKLISSGDGFKNFKSDLKIKKPNLKKGVFIKKIFKALFKYPFKYYYNSIQFQFILKRLKNYDVVQLINEHSIGGIPCIEKYQMKILKKQNKSMFLLCCGEDFNSVNYYLNFKSEFKYSILTPYVKDKRLKSNYEYSLKYLTKPFKNLSKTLHDICDGIISTDLDYHFVFKNKNKYLGMIPNPIILLGDNHRYAKEFKKINHKKINVLLGINSSNYLKKGIMYFEKLIGKLKSKFPEVVFKVTYDLPFEKYMVEVAKTDILLDQIYSYDQGYNALEAMALGKVVFTGGEKIFLKHYKISEDEVVINTLPDINYLVKKMSYLLNNPNEIKRIGRNAKKFVIKYHDSEKISGKYLQKWGAI